MTKQYDSNLLKGTGLINETLILLENYEPEISKEDMIQKVLGYDLLGKATETRAKDIVTQVFYRRYIKDNGEIALSLKQLREFGISISDISQLFLIYTARTNLILQDFLIEVYHPAVERGMFEIKTEDPKIFIAEAINDGRIEKSWSSSTIQKVSEHIIASLIDFRLIDKRKMIIPFNISELVANYLSHEIHFQGLGDKEMVHHEDWKMFGMDVTDVANQLERLSIQGHFIFQSSGDIIKINWKYKSLLNFVENGIGSKV